MKKIFLLSLIFFVTIGNSSAQNWTYVEDFAYGWGPHGVVVTPDGKIWVGYYGYSEEYVTPEGEVLELYPIWIFKPDGSVHHKIYILHYNSEEYPIFDRCRGLSLDNNGNVLFSVWDKLWRINFRTYQAMNMVVPHERTSLTEAACDRNGFIYITHVAPSGLPFYIYDQNFNLHGYVDESVWTLQRSVVVAPGGHNIFLGRIYGGDERNGIIHYRSNTGNRGTYEKVATYHPEIWGQCLDIDHRGLLWVGSYWNVGEDDLNGWYGLDPRNGFAIVNQIGANVGSVPDNQPPFGGAYYSPRGAAWSRDGKTLYTADFDGHVIKKWQAGGAWKISENGLVENNIIPTEFALKQNYPNPFNPTTIIEYQLPEAAHVTINIYDLNGNLITTLLDEQKEPGTYSIQWNPLNNATGYYFYKIRAGNFQDVKKMLYLK